MSLPANQTPEEIAEKARRKQLRDDRRLFRRRPYNYVYKGPGKKCRSCKRKLPLGMFSASIVRGRKYVHSRCITCRARFANHSPACKEKRALLDELRSKPCHDCKQTFAPTAMVFDHVRGIKRFSVSQAWTGRSAISITEEAKKCDVVCAICMTERKKRRNARGMRRHFKLADLPPELTQQVDLCSRLAVLHGAVGKVDQAARTSV